MEESKRNPPSADLTADKSFASGGATTSDSSQSGVPGLTPGTPIHAVFQPNQMLAGRFRVIRFIARGGMGEVYEAEDEELNERVAVKTARFESAKSAHEVERFRREIQLARKVTHPNVCRTFDVFRHGTTPLGAAPSQILIVSMEYLSGETLDHRVRGSGRMGASEALPIAEQMCAGLAAAHHVGVIHRDFKSANVMLVRSRESSAAMRAVVTDFGLAHAEERAEHTLTQPGDIVGTPSYMAPEQLEGGAITPATDIYALGIVLYEMVTGQLPFSADTPFAVAMKRLKEPAPAARSMVPDLDPAWDAAIRRCLEREPEKRFASTDDVAKALRGESVDVVVPEPKPSPAPKPAWVRVVAALVLAAVFIAGAVEGTLWWFRHRAAEHEAEIAQAAEQAMGERKSVAILGFQNLSGRKDADALGNILSDSLWSQLDTDALRVIPPARVDEMKQNLNIGDGTKSLTKDQIAAIRKFLGADVLVLGSYNVNGPAQHGNVQWNIHLVNGVTGESTGSVAQSGNESELNGLVVHSGRLVRQNLGVTLSAAEEARMDASLSSNADAMRYYAEAREKLRRFDVLAATKLLQQSVGADPQFAQAHSALAQAWDALGFESKAAEEAQKALGAAKGLSAEAKSRANAQLYSATRDWPKAIQEYSQLWAQYRDEPEYGLALANTQNRAGKSKDALTTIGQLRTQSMPPGVKAQVDLAEAAAHDALGDFKQELAVATNAAQSAQSMGANLLLARARILQCGAHLSLGEADQATSLCEEAKKLNVAAGDPLGAARASNDIATAYFAAGNLTAAEPLYQDALSISQSIGDAFDEAGALNNLANIESLRGDHAGAVKNYEQAIRVAHERNELGDVARAEQNMATDLYAMGDSTRGAEMFASALKGARDLGDKDLEAHALNNQCIALLSSGVVVDARKSCEASLVIRREIANPGDVGRSLTQLGSVQLAAGDLTGASKSFNDSLASLDTGGAKADAGYARISLAQLAMEQNRLSDAAKYANDAATELASEKDSMGEAEARLMLARAMLASGNVPGAKVLSDKASELAAQSGDRGTKLDAAVVAAMVAAKTGKLADAITQLSAAQKDARAAGLISTEYDARLALGETQIAAGRKNDGRATLKALAQEAKSHGFGLVAQKAQAVVSGLAAADASAS
jgi:tetratricopeptide (TPR) repeat protein/tRNA A-37 threonylcarbamoyl transferase component Bud32/TolB-like protein